MKTDPIQPTQPLRSFILRLLVDAHGELRGQISEPGSEDEWRITFAGPVELWASVVARVGQFNQSTLFYQLEQAEQQTKE